MQCAVVTLLSVLVERLLSHCVSLLWNSLPSSYSTTAESITDKIQFRVYYVLFAFNIGNEVFSDWSVLHCVLHCQNVYSALGNLNVGEQPCVIPHNTSYKTSALFQYPLSLFRFLLPLRPKKSHSRALGGVARCVQREQEESVLAFLIINDVSYVEVTVFWIEEELKPYFVWQIFPSSASSRDSGFVFFLPFSCKRHCFSCSPARLKKYVVCNTVVNSTVPKKVVQHEGAAVPCTVASSGQKSTFPF